MKYVVFYESADDLATKAPAHFAAHAARYQEFVERGELLMIGPFADPQEEGSMAVFTTRAARGLRRRRSVRAARRGQVLVHPGVERGPRPVLTSRGSRS
jgi:uncharacterized protein YciI